MPKPDVLKMYERWLVEHAAPAEQMVFSSKPLDYWTNLNAHAAATLCGCAAARLRDTVELLELGELDSHTTTLVKQNLLPVLKQMDVEDTEHVVQTLLLSGDLRTAYDMWHSQNRNAEYVSLPPD